MKLRTLVLALASTALPGSAQAADDFCNRLIIQAVNQFCQLLPNGLNLCQPVALVGPGPECATPGRQALVPVPLGPPTLQALAPWAAPYASRAFPAIPVASLPPPARTSPAAAAPATVATPPDLPRIMVEVPKPIIAKAPPPLPSPASATTLAHAPLPPPAIAATPIAAPAPVARPTPSATPAAATQAEPAPAAPPMAAAATATAAPASAPQATPVTTPPSTPAEDAAAADALAHFDFDSADLTTAGRAVLDAWLTEAPKNDKPVRISGYADRLGPEPYNLYLSLRRAETVKQYLAGKGIDLRRIQIEAKGEGEPVKRCKGGATPATKACLAPNRRVKIDPK